MGSGFLCLVLSGCTVLVDPGGRSQCDVDGDCAPEHTGLGNLVCSEEGLCIADPEGPDLSCLGEREPLLSKDPYDRTVQVIDFTTVQPVEGVTVRVCIAADLNCDRPADTQTTDAEGRADVRFPAYFQGYVELEREDYIPFAVMNTQPQTFGNYPMSVLSWKDSELVGALLRETPDTQKAHFATEVWDCAGQLLPKVRFDVEPMPEDALIAYLQSGLPSATATTTDASGMGLVINMDGEPTRVTPIYAPDGRALATPRTLHLRPGWLWVLTFHVE